MVLLPMKCTWIPKLLYALLNFSPSLWMYGTTMEMFLLFDPLLLLLLLGWLPMPVCPLWVLCLKLNFCCRVLRAHGGKL